MNLPQCIATYGHTNAIRCAFFEQRRLAAKQIVFRYFNVGRGSDVRKEIVENAAQEQGTHAVGKHGVEQACLRLRAAKYPASDSDVDHNTLISTERLMWRKWQSAANPPLPLRISRFKLLYPAVAVMAFGRQSCRDPALFSFRVVTDIGVSHGRQFTGGVL